MGGSSVDIQEAPYTITLRIDGKHVGGGTVVSITTAVTSAHQITVNPPSRYSIKAGSENRLDRGHDPLAQIRTVSEYVVHHKFKPSTLQNNIAIVKWVQPLLFHATVRAVFVPPPNYKVPYGKMAQTTGWGFTEKKKLTYFLREMRTPLVDNKECNRAQGGGITADMICAGDKLGHQGICNADNGGPLVYKTEHSFVLLGVASWSKGCAKKGVYDVYTRVPFFSDWIRNQI